MSVTKTTGENKTVFFYKDGLHVARFDLPDDSAIMRALSRLSDRVGPGAYVAYMPWTMERVYFILPSLRYRDRIVHQMSPDGCDLFKNASLVSNNIAIVNLLGAALCR